MQEKGQKITIIVTKKPYNDAVSAPFSTRLSPSREIKTLIIKTLKNRGDSDRRFATFYFLPGIVDCRKGAAIAKVK